MSRLTTPLTVAPCERRVEFIPPYRNTEFPIIIDSDNNDGTYQAHYDFDRMSTTQKLLLAIP